MVRIQAADFASFRREARSLLARGVSPEAVHWCEGAQVPLFATDAKPASSGGIDVRVPRAFLERAEVACDHSAPDRFDVLYRLLYRIAHGETRVLEDPLDADGVRLRAMVRDVLKDEHRMHAHVRFRRVVAASGDEHWVAWYRPAHSILARVAPFFARRYPSMRWSILTPSQSAHWDGGALTFGPGAPRADAPPEDELDSLFLTYYERIWNPARTNLPLYKRHMPAAVRAQLPETTLVHTLARETVPRRQRLEHPSASASVAWLPDVRELDTLAASLQSCRACPIGENAQRGVFGEGPRDAKLMIVGEQPGDEEDKRGRPFVGPAGQLLDTLLAEAGIDRTKVYVTNAVKHFKWEPRGKRRLHVRPTTHEVDACRGWLMAEIAAIRPEMILCLGATAAQSFCGPGFRVKRDRGRPMATPWAAWWMASHHPAAIVRATSEEERVVLREELSSDLRKARGRLLSVGS
jgi:DNA polymerase